MQKKLIVNLWNPSPLLGRNSVQNSIQHQVIVSDQLNNCDCSGKIIKLALRKELQLYAETGLKLVVDSPPTVEKDPNLGKVEGPTILFDDDSALDITTAVTHNETEDYTLTVVEITDDSATVVDKETCSW
ncbi:unnamed protein product [Clavelina lepadiformis]|uniref:Uncharacterized protein n=1 Tax=Clavelina lepadiformis TaxID=159417 RepID=A0ABP0FZF9_CLALP